MENCFILRFVSLKVYLALVQRILVFCRFIHVIFPRGLFLYFLASIPLFLTRGTWFGCTPKSHFRLNCLFVLRDLFFLRLARRENSNHVTRTKSASFHRHYCVISRFFPIVFRIIVLMPRSALSNWEVVR